MQGEFRAYDPATDFEQVTDLYSQVYRGGEAWPSGILPVEEDESLYVVSKGGRILAATMVHHMVATVLGGEPVACAGVAAVAVRPESRGTGLGSEMIEQTIALAERDGYALSHLYAFREAWYRRLGWEVCGRRFRVSCPTSKLPTFKGGLEPREIEGEHKWKQVQHVYASFASRYSGMNLRKPSQWRTVVERSTDFWGEQHISETAWASRAGYEGLISLFAAIGANRSAISWYEPSDSPFLMRHMEQGAKMQLDRPIMYRVVDVPSAVAALRPEGSGEFNMCVSGEPWRVSYGAGRARAECGGRGELLLDYGQLAQAILGEPSLQDLLAQGIVSCASSTDGEAACRLFRPAMVYCMDFF